jgi:hypothetical protein
MDDQKLFLSEREVNAIFGLGIRQLRHMRMAGTGPGFVKVSGTLGSAGGRVLYEKERVRAWLASRPQGGEGRGND